MPWTWRYEKADGAVVTADDLQEAIFVSQGDAESWLGENWRALLAIGVDQVTLLEDARTEYGPRGRHPQLADLQGAHDGVQRQAAHGLARHPLVEQPAQVALDELGLDQQDHGQDQDQRRDEALRRLPAGEHADQQEHQDIHVVLADAALGVDVVAGQRPCRPAVLRVERPGLAALHGLHLAGPLGAGLRLFLGGARPGLRPGPGDGL